MKTVKQKAIEFVEALPDPPEKGLRGPDDDQVWFVAGESPARNCCVLGYALHCRGLIRDDATNERRFPSNTQLIVNELGISRAVAIALTRANDCPPFMDYDRDIRDAILAKAGIAPER